LDLAGLNLGEVFAVIDFVKTVCVLAGSYAVKARGRGIKAIIEVK
jgi:hypothetical protein